MEHGRATTGRPTEGNGGRPQVAPTDTQDSPTVSRIIKQFKGSISRQIGFSLWQRSYYDHIIHDEADYLRIWDYIDTNPLKWEEDEYYRP
ncbi:MAG: transposase [Clostridiales bacterium]|nr:transposase [Clostridiales bacterium]